MVESLNTKVDLSIDATSFMGLSEYGKIMVGDHAFEFYNNRSAEKYIQIPWEEVDVVIASVMFGGKWIPRYAIRTKKNGTFTFHPKNRKKSCERFASISQKNAWFAPCLSSKLSNEV